MADRRSVPSLSPLFIIYSLIALRAGCLSDLLTVQEAACLVFVFPGWMSRSLRVSLALQQTSSLTQWLTRALIVRQTGLASPLTCWMIHWLAEFLSDCLVFQMRSEQSGARSCRDRVAFCFLLWPQRTQTTLLMYTGWRWRMNRHCFEGWGAGGKNARWWKKWWKEGRPGDSWRKK